MTVHGDFRPGPSALDFTYFNAVYTVENALAKVKDEKGMKRVEKFLKEDVCPDCSGTRLSEAARAPRLRSISLDEACTMTLGQLVEWVRGVPGSLPQEMRPMAERICERQRMQLARAVHRPAPAGRAGAAGRFSGAAGQRGHGRCHRARLGRHP